MGFGPTSSSILLAAGLAPAAVSATVNIAKVATGTAGGVAHYRFGNVDTRLVLQLAGPGVVGAVIGVTVLANIDGDRLRPWLSTLLLVVGLRMVLRFRNRVPATAESTAGPTAGSATDALGSPARRTGLMLAAMAGGVTNGLIGAWGPVVTPVLLSRDDIEPRVAIGSVNTAEIAVALAASGSLLASMGGAGIDAGILTAMLVGGTLAAPVAAWAVRRIPARQLGAAAGGLLLVTSIRDLACNAEVGLARWPLYALVVAACIVISRRPAPTPVAEPATTPS
jgi:uncharacterized membrane protein YfcA